MIRVIGITGTIGAGKGTIVDYLLKEKDFRHFSVREFLLKQIRKQGLPENRDSMVSVANELRRKHSPSFIADELFKQAVNSGQNAVIESIRTPGEVEFLKKKSEFILLAVDADPEIRYKRIVLRNSETDHIDFRTFRENEKREMDSDDPSKQNLRQCIRMADFRLDNNGTIDDLLRQVDHVLEQITVK